MQSITQLQKAGALEEGTGVQRLSCIRLKWEFQPSGRSHLCGHVLVADGDGKREVFAGSYTHSIYCLDGANGLVIWSYEVEGGVVGCDCITLADADGDGKLELIFGTEPNPTLYVLRTERKPARRVMWRCEVVGAFVAGGIATFSKSIDAR